MSTKASSEPAVIIVGAGPAGLVAAITLARYGLRCLLVERRDGSSTLPRATGVSTRTMEILRSWGLEDEVRVGAVDARPQAWVGDTLGSPDGFEMPTGYPNADQAAAVSPTRPAWVPQDHVEPVLLAHASAYAAVEVRVETELLAIEQDDDGVVAHLHDRRSGERRTVRSRFLIGADGAHSTVRAQLGIALEGPDGLAHWDAAVFHAPLGRARYGLNIITHPDASGILLPVGPDDRWLYGREWSPGQSRLADHDAGRLAELIAIAAGVPGLRPRVVRLSSVSYAAQVAGGYRERHAFLAGDAAHRITPRGGTGLNTAVHDAHDLGWRLAWVLRGWAGPELLDGYEAERRPVGLRNASRSAERDRRYDVDQALPEDLCGRVPHAWVRHGRRRVSTLDLLGDGLTVLTGPTGARWHDAAAALDTPLPVAVRTLDPAAAGRVGIGADGAVVLRPDGRPVTSWVTVAADSHAALAAAIEPLIRRASMSVDAAVGSRP